MLQSIIIPIRAKSAISMFSNIFLRGVAGIVLLLAAFGSTGFVSAAPVFNPRQTWQLLDYVAVDYANTVKDGRVVDSGEYAEVREFAATARSQLAALAPTKLGSALAAQADRLLAAVEAKAEPAVVADLAHRLANDLLASYPISAVPKAPPDIARAAPIYAQQCAACHGPTGRGDGPVAANLTPPPIAFTDADRADRRSLFALYEVISQGIEGTAMTSFSSLPEEERWALAFYVGGLAYSPGSRAQGEALWRDEVALRRQIPSLEALTRSSQADLAQSIGDTQAREITAYLRSSPQVLVEPLKADAFSIARLRLAESVRAYESGDPAQAKALALSSYLEGVEPVEPTLAARDSVMMREIETTMAQFRAQLGSGASGAEVNAQAKNVNELFDRAEKVLGASETGATTAFLGSLTILLREGLEALLIVIGMIAFLRKAERRDVLPYVHAGWLGALLAGLVTWWIATYLVGISGANREVTEGLSALFAAIVLLSVGIWMHQKSLAGRWQQYLHEKMSAALTRRSAMFLFSLAFIAVYREVFETILFYAAMWSEQNKVAILSGMGVGIALLAVIALMLLRFSKRLPIAKFFSISSFLIAVLAVVLVGKGVAALQEAGWISQALVALPRIEWLGIYPSWQSLLAQCLVAMAAVAGFAMNARLGRVSTPAP